MAVDTKQGGTTNAPPSAGNGTSGNPGPSATLAGIAALSANGQPKRKRPSSLMAQANALPSVENSLDEFIAKANETLIDPSSFNVDQKLREQDEKQKEHDALRWKATEQQMRESQAREDALRRQLAGLQGQLAEAEARAAVAGSGGSQDGIIADLRLRLTMADEKVRTSEEKVRLNEVRLAKLESDLAKAQSAAASAPPVRDSLVGIGDHEAEERVRIAEAKAAKAIAAAKAAAAGLTVNPSDIAAIESGLAIGPTEGPKKTPWGLIVAAFVVGGAIMFAVAMVTMKKDKPAASANNAAPAGQVEKAEKAEKAAAPEAAPAKVTATPIDDKAAAPAADDKAAAPADDAAAKAAADKAAADDAAAAKAAADKAAADDAAAAKADKAAAAQAAADAAAAAKAEKAAAAKAAASSKKSTATKKTTTKKSGGSGIADPFGDAPAPKKKATKKDTGIVDPF